MGYKEIMNFKYMVVSKIGRRQYRPQNTTILVIGTPKRVPPILGSPHRPSRLVTLALVE